MENKKPKIGGGLHELPQDVRDFSHEKVFGSAKPEFPESLIVSAPIKIKDQESTDFCTAYAVTSVSEDQEKVELNPHYNFKATRLIDEKKVEEWGANLRDACKAIVKYGSIEEMYYPFPDKDQVEDRNFLADPKNWPDNLEHFAWEHAKNSFFRVDEGSFDTFDNIRMALMMNKDKSRTIVTGSTWYESWTNAKKGLISSEKPKNSVGGHAFKIFGFITIEDKEYLVAQLSNGTKIGDEGVFYFPRDIVNEHFTYGAYMFHDMPREKAELYGNAGVTMNDSKISRFIKLISFIIKNLI
jgi:hypothetical protein